MTGVEFLAKRSKKKQGFTVLTVVMLVFLCAFTLVLFSLLAWAFITSLKGSSEFDGDIGQRPNVIYFPEHLINEETGKLFAFEHISKVLSFHFTIDAKEVGFGEMAWNTFVYSVGGSFVQTLVCFVTAYMCANYRNIVSKIMFNVAILVMAIPIVGNTAAMLDLITKLHFYNTLWGMLILKANYLGTYFLVFYACFRSMPKDYYEAATIDGAGEFKRMVTIGFPLAKGEFLTVFLINFILLWNDYETPHIYIPSRPTLAYDVWELVFGASKIPSTPPKMMACILLLLPVLAVFLIFQRRLLKNLNVGGIKG